MKSNFSLLGLSLCLVLSFFSCDQALQKNTDLALKSIPENASTVTAFRIPQLMVKADFENFQKLPVYQELIKEANRKNAALGKIVEDPNQSGIDLSQNIYAFTQLADNNPEDVFNGVLIPIQNVDAFVAMLEQMDLPETENVAGVNFVKITRKSGLVWNESLAIIGMTNRYNSNLPQNLATMITAEGPAISKDKNLQKSLANNADIVAWASSNALASYKDAQLMIVGLGFDPDVLKDNFIQGHLNFEKGEVEGLSQFLLNGILTQDLDLLFKDEVMTDFTPYVPGENLGMVFSAALDFKGLNQVLSERPQTKGFLNYNLKEYGLTIDDIAKALGGDILLAYYDQQNNQANEGLFVSNIDDSGIFENFLEVGQDFQWIEKQKDNFYTINTKGLRALNLFDPGKVRFKGKQAYLLLAHDMLFVSADTELLATIETGGFKKSAQMPKDFRQQIGQNIFSALVDFKHFGSLEKEMQSLPLQNLEINAQRASSSFNLKMENQEDNSLRSLLWMINEAYEKDQMELEGEKAI